MQKRLEEIGGCCGWERDPVLSENSRFRLELTWIRMPIEGLCVAAAEFLAKSQPDSDPAGVNHLQFFLLYPADWINRNQQNVIEYLPEEVKVLK